MVDMSVSDDDLAQGQAVLLQAGENFGDVIPGIDDDGFMGDLVARMVQLQRSGPTGKVSRIIPSF